MSKNSIYEKKCKYFSSYDGAENNASFIYVCISLAHAHTSDFSTCTLIELQNHLVWKRPLKIIKSNEEHFSPTKSKAEDSIVCDEILSFNSDHFLNPLLVSLLSDVHIHMKCERTHIQESVDCMYILD